jgi:hypothetical protein
MENLKMKTDPAFFDRRNGKLISVWAIQPTGDWEKDCKTGRKHATSYLQYLRTPDASPGLLMQIVKAMPRQDMSGVECGFFHAISETAMQ